MLLVVLLVSLVVYAVSFVLLRLLSRYRELCADRAGAYLTMKPAALASALQKISGETAPPSPTKDLRAGQLGERAVHRPGPRRRPVSPDGHPPAPRAAARSSSPGSRPS